MTTTLQTATATVLDHYDQVAAANRGLFNDLSGDTISRSDLEAIIADPDPSVPQDLRDAAQFLLDSDASRNFLDDAAGARGGALDGKIGRDDLSAALEAIRAGTHHGDLVATAAGGGSRWLPAALTTPADIEAALLDPGVPAEVKDALRLATLSGEGSVPQLAGRTNAELAAAAALYNSEDFRALSPDEQALVSEAYRNGHGELGTLEDLQAQIADPSFQALSADARGAVLQEFVLVRSPDFQDLPADDQQRIRDTLAAREPGDTGLPATIAGLIAGDDFQALDADTRTAVLSQLENYPQSEVAANLERTLAKDWFQDQSVEDRQRSLKVIAGMTADEDGDRVVLDNTLDRLLDPDSDYALKWDARHPDSNGNITSGWNPHDSHDVYLNSVLFDADNDPLAAGDESRLALNTLPHEVSHAVNGDSTDQTYHYLNEEYRAWYVGYQAENGRPPSNEEAMARWEYFLSETGGYAEYSHGIERRFWWDTDGALDKPDEAQQIFDLLSEFTGLDVDAGNYRDVLAMDPADWNTNPDDPAATDWPDGDDLDN